jgi:hypothetical protein
LSGGRKTAPTQAENVAAVGQRMASRATTMPAAAAANANPTATG